MFIVIIMRKRRRDSLSPADSDNWHLHLAEKPMVRSYHLLDYD